MKILKNYKSTLILVVSILVGALVGIIWGGGASVLKPFGDIFLNMLLVIVVPLIFLSIATSIYKMKQPKRMGKILVTTFIVFLVTSVVAVLIGIVSTYSFKLVNTEDGKLMVWTYSRGDEYNLDYFISNDLGSSWCEHGKSFCPKRIRNPQVARVRGGFILHGRSGCETNELPINFVLYTSEDGIHWDEGIYLCDGKPRAGAFYSNNLVLNDENGDQRVLIQSSIPWRKWDEEKGCGLVNIAHWMLHIK